MALYSSRRYDTMVGQRCIAAVATLACVVTSAAAQELTATPPGAIKEFQLGPVFVTPTFQLTNIGIDTNVFNVTDDERRETDFTATVQPGIELRARGPRLTVVARPQMGLVYYAKQKSEEALNPAVLLGAEYQFSPRLATTVTADVGRAKQRLGYELDIRPTVLTKAYDATTRVIGRRVQLDASAAYREGRFHPRDVASGVPLETTMNRITKTAGIGTGYRLTPYTSLTLGARIAADRFPLSRERDTDSGELVAGIELNPRAVIAGRAAVGVRRLVPLRVDAPALARTVIRGGLSWRWQDRVSVTVGAERDSDYSYQPDRFYFEYDMQELATRYVVWRRWDVGARASRTTLSYFSPIARRIDGNDRELLREVVLTTGVLLPGQSRIGVYVSRWERRTGAQPYATLRGGLELTFGGVNANERGVYVSGPGR